MEKIRNRWRCAAVLAACCVMCMVFSMPASAATCLHEWVITGTQWYNGEGFYFSETQCSYKYVSYVTCKRCGEVRISSPSYTYKAHSFKTYAATCNGKIQTHYMSCTNCKYTTTRTQICPAGPHTGNCTALPVSVKPEELIQ